MFTIPCVKRGSGACKTPRLNADNFEKLIAGNIRENSLTESSIRDLVKLLDEEMDGVAREQRERLETIEGELEEVKRRVMLDSADTIAAFAREMSKFLQTSGLTEPSSGPLSRRCKSDRASHHHLLDTRRMTTP